MTASDPSGSGSPASPVCCVRVQQHDEGEVASLPQEEHRHDLHPTTNNHVVRDIHAPHAERFEPKEEDWLFGIVPIRSFGVASIVVDDRQGDSDAHEGQSASHVKRGSSSDDEAPVDGAGKKCSYCIASDFHAPHLHNVRFCTCAFRCANGVGSNSTESAIFMNATSSAPRFDPSQLLRRSTHSSDDLVPVNDPGPFVAGGDANRARRNGIFSLTLSRSSMAGTGATIYRPQSMLSQHAPGLAREAASSTGPMARRDDPKGEKPMAAPPPPPPSDLSSATESESSTETDDDVTVIGDDDDDPSSHTSGPSTSVGLLEGSRKRRRRNPSADDSRPRFAATSRVHQRRRMERRIQSACTVTRAPSRRASCGCNLTGSPSSVEELIFPHGSAMKTLEQSHERVGACIASCFASNQSLQAELTEARQENERLGQRVTAAERDAFRYWEERWMETRS